MSDSHLQSERSTHGFELVPVQILVLVLVGGSGGHPGASSRPRHPPCCRTARILWGRRWVELRRCQVTRIRLLLVPDGTEVWVSSLFRFQHSEVWAGLPAVHTVHQPTCCRWLKEVRGTINMTPRWWHHGNKTGTTGSSGPPGKSRKDHLSQTGHMSSSCRDRQTDMSCLTAASENKKTN